MQATKLNLDLLSNLLKDNKNAIKQALELFVETTIEDMEILQEKIHDKKLFEASRLAHSLKSRFVYLGNDEASQKIRNLEALLKDGREHTHTEIGILFNSLDSLINYCIEQVNEEIKALQY